MPTQSYLSRYWRMKTSGNDVEVVVPAEPTQEDIRRTEAFFTDVIFRMRQP